MFDKDAFAAEVAEIAKTHAVADPAALTGQINDALQTKLAPVTDRLDVLEGAVSSLADALAKGDAAAAQAIVTAIPPAPAPDAPANDTGPAQ